MKERLAAQCYNSDEITFISMQAGYTALNLAARQGHTSIATLLLQNGADIENMDKEVCFAS